MTTSAISGTILAAQIERDKTILRLATGGNGSKREENVVLPGQPRLNSARLAAGKAIRLVNFVRADDGALVPGEQAKLSIVRPAQAEATPAVSSVEPPTATVTQQEVPAPTPEHPLATPPPPAIIPTAAHHGGIMAFSDKRTRRAIFNRSVEVAREFADHIRRSGQIIKIQGRDYVTVAGWSLLPAFETANCYTVAYQIGEDGTVYAEAVVEKNGEIASRGFGACSEKDRPKINDRLAMAQTRARGSALKARYSVLVTLAGYEASLADEVEAALVPAREASVPKPPPLPAPKPTTEQLAFALKMFDGDTQALLAAAANLGLLVFAVNDITTPVLKRIVEQRVNDRKRQRAEAAAKTA